MDLLNIDSILLSRGERKVLQGLSLQMDRGDRIVIRGENGSGKTTLLKAILGLLPVDSGTISINGAVIGSRPWQQSRREAAWVPQDGVLHRFPIAAEESVAVGLAGVKLPRKELRERVAGAMEAAGASHLAGRCFHRLSGGERQRLSIARCLAQGASLMLLDEPASALDTASRERLVSLISGLPEIAMIAVTHEEGLFPREVWRHLQLKEGRLC